MQDVINPRHTLRRFVALRFAVARRRPVGVQEDVTGPPEGGLNVRTTVHEYGGGDYSVADGTLYFCNFK